MGLRTIDLSYLSSMCSTSRSDELKNIVMDLGEGERAKLVTSDPEVSYAIKSLSDVLGYRVVSFRRVGGVYEIVIERYR